MRISNSQYGAIITLSGLLVVLLLVIFPSVLLFTISFIKYDFISIPSFTGFGNYKYIFQDRLFWLSLKKAAIYASGTTFLMGVTGLILAIFLSRITKGRTIFRTLMMFSWAVPLVISGYIWKWMFDANVGIINYILMSIGFISEPLSILSNTSLAMLACIVADAWVGTPFIALFALAGIESIPKELYEVATIDGADFLDSLWYITLPLIRRMVLIALLICSMFAFRTIDAIMALTAGGPARGTYVLGLYIVDQLWKRIDYGTSAAGSVIMFVLISIFVSVYIYWLFKER